MVKLASVFICLLLLSQSVNANEFVDDRFVGHHKYPAWFEEPFMDLETDLDEALEAGETGLMLFFTTEGCSYCEKFSQVSLGDPELASLVQKNFDSIGLEIFDDAEITDTRGNNLPVKEYAKQTGATMAPTLMFYGPGGDLILRAVGYQSPQRFRHILNYITEGHYRNSSLKGYLRTFQKTAGSSATLREDPLFITPPYALDRSHFAASEPMLVLFEKADCKDCGVLHDNVLADPDVRELLGEFEVVRLDASDNQTPVLTPGGKKVTPAAWYEKLDFSSLPAYVFFNEEGRNVLQTDAIVLQGRMINSCNYVLEKAYEKNWTYQRFARTSAIEKNNQQASQNAAGKTPN